MANIQKWEYIVLGYTIKPVGRDGFDVWADDTDMSITDSLKDFGNDGWELVSTTFNPDDSSLYCFFKRPRP